MTRAYTRTGSIDPGTKFGASTVITETTAGSGGRRFSVKCDCGSIRTVDIRLLRKVTKGQSQGKCRKCAYKKA